MNSRGGAHAAAHIEQNTVSNLNINFNSNGIVLAISFFNNKGVISGKIARAFVCFCLHLFLRIWVS